MSVSLFKEHYQSSLDAQNSFPPFKSRRVPKRGRAGKARGLPIPSEPGWHMLVAGGGGGQVGTGNRQPSDGSLIHSLPLCVKATARPPYVPQPVIILLNGPLHSLIVCR